MKEDKDTKNYDDIINLPHPTSAVHKRMPLKDRAAQFSPFAALNGYGEAIQETARAASQEGVALPEGLGYNDNLRDKRP